MRLSLRARITVMFLGTALGVGLALIGLVYTYLKLTPVPLMAQIPTPDEGLVSTGRCRSPMRFCGVCWWPP